MPASVCRTVVHPPATQAGKAAAPLMSGDRKGNSSSSLDKVASIVRWCLLTISRVGFVAAGSPHPFCTSPGQLDKRAGLLYLTTNPCITAVRHLDEMAENAEAGDIGAGMQSYLRAASMAGPFRAAREGSVSRSSSLKGSLPERTALNRTPEPNGLVRISPSPGCDPALVMICGPDAQHRLHRDRTWVPRRQPYGRPPGRPRLQPLVVAASQDIFQKTHVQMFGREHDNV